MVDAYELRQTHQASKHEKQRRGQDGSDEGKSSSSSPHLFLLFVSHFLLFHVVRSSEDFLPAGNES